MIIYSSDSVLEEIDRLVVLDDFKKNFKYHYVFIVSHIRSYRFFNKIYKSDDYVPVNLALLRKYVSHNNAKQFLDNLINHGIIECNGEYRPSLNKSFGYRLTEKYRNNKFRVVEIEDKKLLKKINDRCKKDMEVIVERNDAYAYVTKCMEKLSIDEKTALQYVETIEDSETQESLYITTKLFKDKFVKIDSVGNRLHNNLTNLSSKLRKYVTYNGKKLVQVDIKNSQPLFLYLLLRDNYFVSDDEMEKYRTVVCEYGFYEFFAERLSFNLTKSNRKDFKQKIFGGVLFDRNRKELSKYEEVFKREFPQIYHVIRKIKEVSYRDVAVMLQRTESKFVFSCIDRLKNEHNIPLFTIHDSICSTEGNEKLIEKVIHEDFANKYDINTKLNIETFA